VETKAQKGEAMNHRMFGKYVSKEGFGNVGGISSYWRYYTELPSGLKLVEVGKQPARPLDEEETWRPSPHQCGTDGDARLGVTLAQTEVLAAAVYQLAALTEAVAGAVYQLQDIVAAGRR
jgi:hypothetical protein